MLWYNNISVFISSSRLTFCFFSLTLKAVETSILKANTNLVILVLARVRTRILAKCYKYIPLNFLCSISEMVSPANLSKTFSPPSPPGLAGVAALEDPSPDQFKVRVQLSTIVVTLLHVDPVLSPTSSATNQWQDDPPAEATHPLTQMAMHFFKTVGTCRFGQNDFENMKVVFNEACCCDHLR